MPEEQEHAYARQARGRLGTTLGAKYRLDRLLGVGGMASVYAATHRNGNRVAVKMLHGPLAVDPDVRRRFLREGYVANRVSHPGAVQVTDDCEAEDGTAFLVMELLEGESLDIRWQRFDRRMPPREVLALTYELLATLASAHAHGIVHRDIKPANVFVTLEGKVKVLDFGIARLLEATAGHAHTHTGRAVGTPAFMPAEQALGKSREIDGQTDLWAVGATMFTLLSGQDVHQAENVSEQLVFAATKPSRSLAVALPEAAPEIVGLVDRAIAFAKTDRWADARAMRDAIAEVHLSLFGEGVEVSVGQLASDDLGPIRSASPRAFAPTVRSTPPPGASDGTVPSTELRASQLGSGHPTTGGGVFSVSRTPSIAPGSTLRSLAGSRRRSLSLLGATAAAVVIGAGLMGARPSRSAGPESNLATASPNTDDMAAAMPVGLDTPALSEPRPEAVAPAEPAPTHAAARAPSPSPTPAAVPPAGSSGVKPKPPAPVPATPASAAAAQGGVVVTVPY